uniref:Uncharacterized protein n=1 Tax=Arundo donax TaxID=35708 RepID=A0A0A9V6X7_ARUDO
MNPDPICTLERPRCCNRKHPPSPSVPTIYTTTPLVFFSSFYTGYPADALTLNRY